MKKNTSIKLLEVLQEYYSRGKDIYTIKKEGIVKFVDIDPNSDFYFKIEKEEINGSNHILEVSYKPFKENSIIGIDKRRMDISDLKKCLESWMIMMSKYNQLKYIDDLEDPIVESFAEEYYDTFEIIDEDAEINPYPLHQIEKIEFLLTEIQTKIEKDKEKIIEQSSPKVVEEIEERIQDIRQTIYKSTKKTISKKISRLFGFMTKEGGNLVRILVQEGVKEAIKIWVKSNIGIQ
ncbi:hypothetical protein [Myroides odoratus]|uniref:Uncharacterized protein n=1 Tax=Myroides odoratus TaxID=256 RepID=A0A378RPR3_MYROD|nr:hypothetical protein [Myroides odoratus]QQU04236.1 hypothetical protein I6I89_02830 [Myroides odoratus]STZ28349.1 Uncharacterised protein [Myroides odoratus]